MANKGELGGITGTVAATVTGPVTIGTLPNPGLTTGSLAANGATFEIDTTGSASAVISVSGTFIGTLTVTGSNDATTTGASTNGGRLLFKSGIGSLGTNQIVNAGVAINNEYRILTGGKSIKVTMSAYTSGTATIKIVPSINPSLTFINGPVHDAMEEAIRAGRAFSVGTGVQAAAIGTYLKSRFANPSNSGVNCFVTLRSFTNNATGGTLPELQIFTSVPAMTSPTAVTPSNLKNGAASSVVDFSWKMEATILGGTAGAGLIVPNSGVPRDINTVRLVQPGESFGYVLGGAGGILTSALRGSMVFTWYEEAIN